MKFTTVILALAIVCANARRPSEVWTSEQEDAAGIVKNNYKTGLAFNSVMGKPFQEKYFNLIDEIKKGNLSPALIISMKHI